MVGTPSLIYSTVGDGRSSLRPRVHYTKLCIRGERRRCDSHNNSRDSSPLIYSTVGDGRSSLRPRVHYTELSSTREQRRSDPHDNSQDSSSLTFATVGDGSSYFHSKVYYTKMSSTFVKKKLPSRQQSGFFVLSHIWWTLSSLIFRPSVMVATPPFLSA